jgi:hypothetical protein
MRKNLYEVFEEFEKAPTREAKINVLRADNRQVLKNLLQGAFNPAIKYVFKEPLEYKRSDAPPGMGYSSLDMEFRRVYIFVEGSQKVDPNLSLERKKHILIQILESLEAKEAEIFMNMMLKDLKVKGLTPKIVEEAFPGLL